MVNCGLTQDCCGDDRDPALQCRCPYSGRTWGNRRLAEELDPSCYSLAGGYVSPLTGEQTTQDPPLKPFDDIIGGSGLIPIPVENINLGGFSLSPLVLIGGAAVVALLVMSK